MVNGYYEFKEGERFNCDEIKKMISQYDQENGAKGYNHYIYKEFKLVANFWNVTTDESTFIKQAFLECKKYTYRVDGASGEHKGVVVYAKKIQE